MTKYYGVFEVSADTRKKGSLQEEKDKLTKRILELGWNEATGAPRGNVLDCFGLRAVDGYAATEKDDRYLVNKLSLKRQCEAHSSHRGPCRYRVKHFIHECTEDGWWLPTRGEEQRAAQEQN